MQALVAHRRITSWLAALAVLLAALAPTLSHAVASATGSNWVEICTAQGAKWVQTGDDGADSSPASAQTPDHCPYCLLQAQTLGLPPAPLQALPPLPLRHERPLAFLAAPRTLHAWVTALPRAPPLFA